MENKKSCFECKFCRLTQDNFGIQGSDFSTFECILDNYKLSSLELQYYSCDRFKTEEENR